MTKLVLLAAAAFALPAGILAQSPAGNPLLIESTLPYHLPPFDRIKDADFAPALEQGMADHLKEVEAIADDPAPVTFDNTIVALERSGRLLERVDLLFSNLAGANTNPAIQKIETEMAPKQAAHADAVRLNTKLFARIQSLYDQRDQLGLDAESKYLLERYEKDFVRAGAKLSDADKTKLKAMNAELASLETTFNQDVLKEKNADSIVVTDRAQLAGMSEGEIAATEVAAKADHQDGKFVIRLLNTTNQPALASLQDRALRQRIAVASMTRNSHGGGFDNTATVSRIARLRAERAVLLGYPNHAAYQLDDQTIGSVAAVNKLLADAAGPAVVNARKEGADIQAVIDHEQGGFQLASWDWDLYSEKVRKEKYAFDGAQLKPYFELNHVLKDGVFFAATQLYGITFKERHDLPVYQPDVRVFEVFDQDGTPLALFLADYYARPSKRGGAWMNEYVRQSDLFGDKPLIANHLNIPKPPAGQPTLLTSDEVVTAFHEFGHGLHGMFSHVKYPRFSGTSVPRDFVEYPSQFNEMWAFYPEVLKNYAKHYETGETIPQALVDKLTAANQFNQGFKTTEYLAASLLDQAWHQLKPEEVSTDVLGFETTALKKAGMDYAPVPPRYRSPYFSHSFGGGYSAGYYSYFWSEVLAADSTEWVLTHGGLTRANGDHIRETMLARGGTSDALGLFHDLTGHAPEVGPLLKKRGLDQAAANR